MVDALTSKEEELAKERIEMLEQELIRKRSVSLWLMAGFGVLCSIGLWFEMPMLTITLFVLSLLLLLRYFDANGHLHEVRRRSKKTLFTRLSVIQTPHTSISSTAHQMHPKQ
jgi:uncharacterized membrane protein YhiD involved in acid resistance